jgi:hypothetical protein
MVKEVPMTCSMWLVVAATLALVPYTAHTQTLVTEAHPVAQRGA